jgi:hypothetical protein
VKQPEKKNGPKLPPTPKGGGAAARLRQFQQERGLPAEENPPAGLPTGEDVPADVTPPTNEACDVPPTRKRPPKPTD